MYTIQKNDRNNKQKSYLKTAHFKIKCRIMNSSALLIFLYVQCTMENKRV